MQFYQPKSQLNSLDELDESFKDTLYGKEYSSNKKSSETMQKSIPKLEQRRLKTKATRLVILSENWQQFQKMIIINPFTGKKSIWDIIAIMVVFYSCFTSYFWASFWPEGFVKYYYIEIAIEVFFLTDMIINFLTSFVINPETNELTYSIADTSLNYLKNGFLFDAIAVFPFTQIFPETNLKVVQMIRVIRFFRVIDENSICEKLNRLIDNINPKNKIQMQYTARYVYRIVRFILIGFSIAFYIACAWYIYTTSDWSDDDFQNKYYAEDVGVFKRAIISYYFILSTLATVGYGDFVPQSTQERIIAIITMICGVGFFSYIINNFNDIMKNYRNKLGYIDKTPEVEEWLLSLNLESDKSMDQKLIKKIYDHFNYFYKHYRLVSLTKDDKYFSMMSYSDKRLMIRHLFQDIFSGLFRTFFLSQGKNEFPNYNFYIDIAFALLPRKCIDKEIVLLQGESVEEIYFLIDGEIEVSFAIDGIKVKRYFTSGFQFGCVQILSNSVSNFTYQTTTPVTLYAIKKEPFLTIFNTVFQLAQNVLNQLKLFYKQYPEIKQDIILNAFSTYRLTRKAMMETFVLEIKDKLGIQINEEEANYLFDTVNKKLQKGKKKIIKNNLKIFTNPLKVNQEDLTDSDSDSEKDVSFNERLSTLQDNLSDLNDILNTIQPPKATKQSSIQKSLFQKHQQNQ